MPKLHSTELSIDTYELAAVLAGLRLLQLAIERNAFPPGIEEIATNVNEFNHLDTEEIDRLAERINCA